MPHVEDRRTHVASGTVARAAEGKCRQLYPVIAYRVVIGSRATSLGCRSMASTHEDSFEIQGRFLSSANARTRRLFGRSPAFVIESTRKDLARVVNRERGFDCDLMKGCRRIQINDRVFEDSRSSEPTFLRKGRGTPSQRRLLKALALAPHRAVGIRPRPVLGPLPYLSTCERVRPGRLRSRKERVLQGRPRKGAKTWGRLGCFLSSAGPSLAFAPMASSASESTSMDASSA